MHYHYFAWDESTVWKMSNFQDLLKLFNHLILVTAGDVDTALNIMKRLQRSGYIEESIDLEDFVEELERQGFISKNETAPSSRGKKQLTQKGERQLRRSSLEEIFNNLKKGTIGNHFVPIPQATGEKLSETRPYHFGDSVQDLDYNSSIKNAMKRVGLEDFGLEYDDLEIYETEYSTSCATVLLLDVSHSMILYGEDRITPAKKIALALSELILTKYPKDKLHVVLFGNDAEEISVKDLPYVTVGPYHTNTCAGLQRAQQILSRLKHSNKQIFMITDGKATCIRQEDGSFYKNSFDLDPRILNPTLNEAAKCRRNRIQITTFMVTQDPSLVDFIDNLTQINHGKAYYTSLDNLGEALFVDYVRNRKRKLR